MDKFKRATSGAKIGKIVAIVILAAVLLTLSALGGVLLKAELELNEVQTQMLEELDEKDGEYDTSKIVLNGTTKERATQLAEEFGAKLRITSNGKFATLTLPDGVTVRDIYSARKNRQYLGELSLDLRSSISELETDESGESQPTDPKFTVNDMYFAQQTQFNHINLGDTWASNYTGKGITVAIIDTGIDTDNVEFSGRISSLSYNATTDEVVGDTGDMSAIEDYQGHGTMVAGVIGAALNNSEGIAGVAPDVELLVIKVECDESGTFSNTSDLLFGLYYAIDMEADIVNMSFGGYSTTNAYAEATQLAIDSNVICVAASGNNGTAQLCYPAADKNVIAVGALNSDGDGLETYSNYGDNIDVVAPGTVYTTKINGAYDYETGTSFASPIVAGALALLMGEESYRHATIDEIKELLFASCTDMGSLGHDRYFGYGKIDISALVLGEKGTVTFNMLTDELQDETGLFIKGKVLQVIPIPTRDYAMFDGWYYDSQYTHELDLYVDVFDEDLQLYAKWVNDDDDVPYEYEIIGDTVEINSYTGNKRYVVIPDTIEGKPVTSIAEYVFEGQSNIVEITLPSKLEKIGDYAFKDCTNLISIAIPESVTKIGEGAFYNDIRLANISFEGAPAITNIGEYAFLGSGLTSFEVPAGVTQIDGTVFYGTLYLQSITVAAGNTHYTSENGVLLNANKNKIIAFPAGISGSYNVPNGILSIGTCAFGYTSLSSINFNMVNTIGTYAFSYSSLKSVNLSLGVTQIESYAFMGSAKLTGVYFYKMMTSISESAFEYCTALTSITIPASVKTIDSYAFYGDSSLESVLFEDDSALEWIGRYTFAECGLRDVNIPDSLTKIYDNAFANDYNLNAVNINSTSKLNEICEGAFLNDSRLVEIKLPNSLSIIGAYAFAETGLESIEISSGVSEIDGGAFAACKSLSAITVSDGNIMFISVDGVLYNSQKTILYAYPSGKEDITYTLESNTTQIAEAAFYGVEQLQHVIFSRGIQTINEYAFYGCNNISSYTFSDDTTSGNSMAFISAEDLYIGGNAFAFNLSLTSMYLPANVSIIGDYAFFNDSALTTITLGENSRLTDIGYAAFAFTAIRTLVIPASVTTISQDAFADCTNLTSVTFSANSKLRSATAYLFDGCTSLKSIKFEEGSALVSIVSHAFEGLTGLTGIDFGDAQIEDIGSYAFRFCSSLKSIKIPASVDYIGGYAFYGDSNLNVYILGDTLPAYVADGWDSGICGYYVGVTEVKTSDDKIWSYAEISGGISLIKYNGTSTSVDLTKLELGDIISIGGYCFYGSQITTITLPETLTAIEGYAFANSKITAVELPASVNYIGQYAFYNTQLKDARVMDGSQLQTIEQYAFANTANLVSLNLPESLVDMGAYAFYNSGITEVTFEGDFKLTYLPEYAFALTNIKTVVLPDSITRINHGAFRDCGMLESVTFGNNDGIHLGSNVFYNTALTQLEIPANVTYIGEYSFVGLTKLEEFVVDKDNPYYSSVDGILYNKDVTKLIACPSGKTGKVTVPSTVTLLGKSAFENSSLSEVAFDEDSQIKTIGYRTFYDATELTKVNIPAAVEEFADYAFYGCTSLNKIIIAGNSNLVKVGDYSMAYTGLESLTLPSTVEDIGEYAFLGSDIQQISIPKSDAQQLSIGFGAFSKCDYLTSITVPFIGASVDGEKSSNFGYIFGAGSYTANGDYVPATLTDVTINSDITKVANYAFYGCSSIVNLTLPSSIASIGKSAFYGCSSLVALEIPQNVVAIYDDTFNGCSKLEDLKIDGVIMYIGARAFAGCQKLADFTNLIKYSAFIVSIGDEAFEGTAYYADEANWKDSNLYLGKALLDISKDEEYVKMDTDVSCIADGVFTGCDNLLQLEIGGDHVGLLAPLTNLKTLVINKMPSSYLQYNGNVYYNYLYYYFGNISAVPVTLKQIVLRSGCQINSSEMFKGFTNIEIFVEDSKLDCKWDEDYSGWNNGNTVYYAGEWIEVTFYNTNGKTVADEYYRPTDVINTPYLNDYMDATNIYTFMGWDRDGDGVSDFIPATSMVNISATAIYKSQLICDVMGHDFSDEYTVDTPATCVNVGSQSRHCSRCDEVTDVQTVALSDHDWNIDQVIKAATCLQTGSAKATCNVCGTSDTIELKTLDHDWGDWVETKAATCAERGEEIRVCKIDSTHIEKRDIQTLAHTYDSQYTIDRQPSCATQGYKSIHCLICGEKSQITTIARLEHTVVEDKAVAATCISTGKTAGSHCSVCGEVIDVQSVIAKTDHVVVVDKAVAATCTSSGKTQGSHCAVCDEILQVQRVIAKTDHTPGEWIVDSQANGAGEVQRHRECTVCGEILETQTIAKDEDLNPANENGNNGQSESGKSGGCGSNSTDGLLGTLACTITAFACVALLMILRRKGK